MRRNLFSRVFAGALSGLLLASVAAVGNAQAQDMQKVRIAVGTSFLNIGYPWLTLPIHLGYWKEEGYDVEILPVGASLQALQQMVAGNAEFAQVNSSVIIQANVNNDLPVRIVMGNGVIDWGLAVLADSPYKSVKDLKGKTIGLFSLATGGLPFLKSYLHSNGMDPDKDVGMVAVGYGAPPVDALKTDKVQGLMYWASALAGFENVGLKLRILRADDWTSYPDYSMSVMEATAAKDPKMVEAITRGSAKATVFALANPDCARKVHWKYSPDTKPKGADEATLIKWDLNNLNAQLDSMRAAYTLNGGKYYGGVDPKAYDRLQNFMKETGLIKKTMPAKDYVVSMAGLWDHMNDFDIEAVRAQAMKCPVN